MAHPQVNRHGRIQSINVFLQLRFLPSIGLNKNEHSARLSKHSRIFNTSHRMINPDTFFKTEQKLCISSIIRGITANVLWEQENFSSAPGLPGWSLQ